MAEKLPKLADAQRTHYFIVAGEVDKRGRIVFSVDDIVTGTKFLGAAIWIEPCEEHPVGTWMSSKKAGVIHTDLMLSKDLKATLKRRSNEVRRD